MDAEVLLKQLLADTDGPLAQAEAEMHEAQRKIEKLRAERYGLELALARHRGEPAPPEPEQVTLPPRQQASLLPADDDARQDWKQLPRTEAVLRVLSAAGAPLHRKNIRAQLLSTGRDDNMADLSAALAYLNRTNRVRGLSRGVWSLPEYAGEG